MPSIHFKFRTAKEYDTINFEGPGMSLLDLKAEIATKKKLLDGGAFEFKIVNGQTNEEFVDLNAVIPKNTSVIVSRIPVPPGRVGVVEMINRRKEMMSSSNVAVAASVADMAGPGSETDRVKALTSSEPEWKKLKARPVGYSRNGPPPDYICYKCGLTGHYNRNCPKRWAVGIPRIFLKEIKPGDGSEPADTPALMRDGKMFQMVPDDDTFKRAWSSSGQRSRIAAAVADVPQMLRCPICQGVLRDAVTIPCCNAHFCDECVRERLTTEPNPGCPVCQRAASADAIQPDLMMRAKVERYIRRGAHAAAPAGGEPNGDESEGKVEGASQTKVAGAEDGSATTVPATQVAAEEPATHAAAETSDAFDTLLQQSYEEGKDEGAPGDAKQGRAPLVLPLSGGRRQLQSPSHPPSPAASPPASPPLSPAPSPLASPASPVSPASDETVPPGSRQPEEHKGDSLGPQPLQSGLMASTSAAAGSRSQPQPQPSMLQGAMNRPPQGGRGGPSPEMMMQQMMMMYGARPEALAEMMGAVGPNGASGGRAGVGRPMGPGTGPGMGPVGPMGMLPGLGAGGSGPMGGPVGMPLRPPMGGPGIGPMGGGGSMPPMGPMGMMGQMAAMAGMAGPGMGLPRPSMEGPVSQPGRGPGSGAVGGNAGGGSGSRPPAGPGGAGGPGGSMQQMMQQMMQMLLQSGAAGPNIQAAPPIPSEPVIRKLSAIGAFNDPPMFATLIQRAAKERSWDFILRRRSPSPSRKGRKTSRARSPEGGYHSGAGSSEYDRRKRRYSPGDEVWSSDYSSDHGQSPSSRGHRTSGKSKSRDGRGGRHGERERDRERGKDRKDKHHHSSRERERYKEKDHDRDTDRRYREKDYDKESERDRDYRREKDRSRDRSYRDELQPSRDRDRDRSRERERDRGREKSREYGREKERGKERRKEEKSRRSHGRSKSHHSEKDRGRDTGGSKKSRKKGKEKKRKRSRSKTRSKSGLRSRSPGGSQDRDRDRCPSRSGSVSPNGDGGGSGGMDDGAAFSSDDGVGSYSC